MPAAFVIICRKRIVSKSCSAPPASKIKAGRKAKKNEAVADESGVLDAAGTHRPPHQSRALRSISLIRRRDIDRGLGGDGRESVVIRI